MSREPQAAGPGGEPPAAPLLPAPRDLLNPREPYLVPLLLLLLTRAWFWRLLPFASEDAYITFRYARSLVLGYGLVYNPGERVMGFSSPLWTLWSALGYALLRDPVLWSRAWTVLADAFTVLALGAMLRRHASAASAWCFALFFAGWTYFAAVAVSGMENSVMLALIVLAAALAERRSRLAGPALAGVALIRPEGIAAAAVLALRAAWRDRAVALALVAAALLSVAAYFGSPLPQSVLAKASIYGTPGPLAGRHWWEWLSPFAFGRWPVTTEGSVLFAMAVVTGPAAAVGALALRRMRRTALAAAVAAALVVWLGYAALGVAFFYWYLVAPLGGVTAAVAVGLPRIVRGRAVYAGLALFVLGTWTLAPDLYRGRAGAELQSFGRLADYLVAHARAGQKVMLEPIGMVGYRCKLVVVDQVGLVSPQVARRRLQGPGWLSDMVAAERPDWLVLRQGEQREARAFAGVGAPFRSAAERDSVLAGYTLATVVNAPAGENALAVWARRP